jgi:pantoate--beta-alanine ligase
VHQLHLTVKVIACPTVREADGLAMSSRNMRLSKAEREAAKLIPLLLNEARALKKAGRSITEIKAFINQKLNQNPIYKLDYFEICDPKTLQILNDKTEVKPAIALIACFVGKIRLIDNLVLD